MQATHIAIPLGSYARHGRTSSRESKVSKHKRTLTRKRHTDAFVLKDFCCYSALADTLLGARFCDFTHFKIHAVHLSVSTTYTSGHPSFSSRRTHHQKPQESVKATAQIVQNAVRRADGRHLYHCEIKYH